MYLSRVTCIPLTQMRNWGNLVVLGIKPRFSRFQGNTSAISNNYPHFRQLHNFKYMFVIVSYSFNSNFFPVHKLKLIHLIPQRTNLEYTACWLQRYLFQLILQLPCHTDRGLLLISLELFIFITFNTSFRLCVVLATSLLCNRPLLKYNYKLFFIRASSLWVN